MAAWPQKTAARSSRRQKSLPTIASDWVSLKHDPILPTYMHVSFGQLVILKLYVDILFWCFLFLWTMRADKDLKRIRTYDHLRPAV